MIEHTNNIIVSIPPRHDDSARLREIIEGVALPENIIVVRSTENLLRILRQPLNGVAAAVIFDAAERELNSLLPFKELLLRMPVILVLSDSSTETIAKGHSLRPRFVTYADSDFSDLRDVLRKMLGRMNGMETGNSHH